jgi:hypothetical protein
MPVLCRRLECRAVRVHWVPEEKARYAAVGFELYAPFSDTFLNCVRAIETANDGGRWKLTNIGEPLPFENVDTYKARRVKDRFGPEHLRGCLEQLGLRAFEDAFYLDAAILERSDDSEDLTTSGDVTLEAAQEHYRGDG